MSALLDLWRAAPAAAQDWAILLGLLAPALALGALALRGHSAWPIARALLLRFRWANLAFVALVALAVGVGAALTAQERALRSGAARAAEKFQLIVAAPGDEVRATLSTVYLQPSAIPLLGGATLERLQADKGARLVAPLAFGDTHRGAPVVGSTAEFVSYLSGGPAEGRMFETLDEAVVGALSPLRVGDRFTPTHGHGGGREALHDGVEVVVVGRMRPTGGPWDRAIVAPVEHVWATHGLATGHAPAAGDRIGPPFDAAYFPGTPAFVVAADTLGGAYALRARHDRGETMAFFPGATLARLNGLLGDVRGAMTLMAALAQGLVAAAVAAGLAAFALLFTRRFALLRALGAPRRFVFAVVWSYSATLAGTGAVAGLGVAWIAAAALSREVAARTDIAVTPTLGFPELHAVAAFFSVAAVLALIPAFAAYRRPALDDLRAS